MKMAVMTVLIQNPEADAFDDVNNENGPLLDTTKPKKSRKTKKAASTAASPSSIPSSNNKTNKTVSFDETLNKVYENAPWNKEDMFHRWHPNNDYKIMKENLFVLAKQIYKKEEALEKEQHQEQQQQKKQHQQPEEEQEESYKSVMLRVHYKCVKVQPNESIKALVSKQDKKLLKKTMRRYMDRTGLEKVCISDIGADKRQRRQQLRQSVLDAQDSFRNSNNNNSLMSLEAIHKRDELLRSVSEAVTLSSRLFARYMGIAMKVAAPSTSSSSACDAGSGKEEHEWEKQRNERQTC